MKVGVYVDGYNLYYGMRGHVYLKALRAHRSIDVLELGHYVARAKVAPLAKKTKTGVQIITPTGAERWSLPIQSITTNDGVAMLMATVRAREEKGSDVNVATHLLTDVFRGEIQGAIVISNDSDLALPLTIARTLVPVGMVNPGANPLAGALRGLPGEGVGRHW
jgi:hypothetical protein